MDNVSKTAVLQRFLVTQVLALAHDELGYNDTTWNIHVSQKTILLERPESQCKHVRTLNSL